MSVNLEALKVEFSAWSSDRLRTEFANGLRITVDHLVRMAAMLHELERRGESVTGAPTRILTLLRRISRGELLPEVVVQFAGTPTVLSKIGTLPPERQRMMLDDEEKRKEFVYKHRADSKNRNTEGPVNPLVNAAELATPRDLAEMIVEMIGHNRQPDKVWAVLAEHFQATGRTKASA